MEKPEKERVGMAVRADEQTAGKGMAGNGWESAQGLNLTFSLGMDLSFMKAADQFKLSEAVPMGLLDVLDAMLPPDKLWVKWPNDLVFEGQKLCGILINSTIRGMDMGVSVVGIGLNVNQMEFQPWPTHPVSMKRITGEDYDLDDLWGKLSESVARRVGQLQTDARGIERDYLDRLYRYHQWADYEVNGEVVRRYITGLDPFGRLETLDASGKSFVYDVKSIKFR